MEEIGVRYISLCLYASFPSLDIFIPLFPQLLGLQILISRYLYLPFSFLFTFPFPVCAVFQILAFQILACCSILTLQIAEIYPNINFELYILILTLCAYPWDQINTFTHLFSEL